MGSSRRVRRAPGTLEKSTSQLSLDWAIEQGYRAERVDRRDRRSGHSHDLFGVVDVLAIKPGETLAIQACLGDGDLGKHKRALAASEDSVRILDANWEFEIHSWRPVAGLLRVQVTRQLLEEWRV